MKIRFNKKFKYSILKSQNVSEDQLHIHTGQNIHAYLRAHKKELDKRKRNANKYIE
jgi:hypothetical protein